MSDTPEAQFSYPEMLRHNRVRRGILNIEGDMPVGAATFLLSELLMMEPNIKDLYIIINSPGGAVSEAFALYDLIASLGQQGYTTYTIATGMAASAAAAIVLQAGHHRQSTPNCRFMLHEIARYIQGAESSSETEEVSRELKKLQERIFTLLGNRVGKSVKQILAAVKRKTIWFSPEEALEWNLIDAIVPGVPLTRLQPPPPGTITPRSGH